MFELLGKSENGSEHKIRHNARQRDNNNITDIQTASKCANFFYSYHVLRKIMK